MELLSFGLGVLCFAVKTAPDVYVCLAHDIVQFTYPNLYITALVSIYVTVLHSEKVTV